jgi:hypothetical protein
MKIGLDGAAVWLGGIGAPTEDRADLGGALK